jgi:integrase/recombinase XerD
MLIEMWLHGRPQSTQNVYRQDVGSFQKFTQLRPIASLRLEDIQAYQTELALQNLKDATKRRKLNTIKSLFSFAAKLNYIQFNVAAAIRLPKASRTLAGRILSRRDVLKILVSAGNDRDTALLELIYATGARVSEICRITWGDFQERDDGAVQITIMGKGGKDRVVLVPRSVWERVSQLQGEADRHTAVFLSVRGKALDRSAAHAIIKAAVQRAGVNPDASCHWLRHAHAQHSLAKGAPLQLVRDSLGHSNISVTNVYLESNPQDSSSNYLDF